MTRYLLASAAALALMTSAGMAQQMSTSQTSTTYMPPAPPPITYTRTIGHDVTADGVQTLSNGVAMHDDSGQVVGTTNSTRTYPLTAMITTTHKSVENVNGVPVETITTTSAYPPGTSVLPPVTRTTKTVLSSSK